MKITFDKALLELRAGRLVVLPTDTVYGFAVDSGNVQAVEALYDLKGRSRAKPFVLLIDSLEMLEGLVLEVTDRHKLLMARFWPGPLTILFKKSSSVSDLISAGLPTIGVRIPYQEQTLRLIKSLGRPIVATSVNLSGQVSLNNLLEISESFPSLNYLDGGDSVLGIESTVLDLTGNVPKILREGALKRANIELELGEKVD